MAICITKCDPINSGSGFEITLSWMLVILYSQPNVNQILKTFSWHCYLHSTALTLVQFCPIGDSSLLSWSWIDCKFHSVRVCWSSAYLSPPPLPFIISGIIARSSLWNLEITMQQIDRHFLRKYVNFWERVISVLLLYISLLLTELVAFSILVFCISWVCFYNIIIV